jgi:hypothetical protein
MKASLLPFLVLPNCTLFTEVSASSQREKGLLLTNFVITQRERCLSLNTSLRVPQPLPLGAKQGREARKQVNNT